MPSPIPPITNVWCILWTIELQLGSTPHQGPRLLYHRGRWPCLQVMHKSGKEMSIFIDIRIRHYNSKITTMGKITIPRTKKQPCATSYQMWHLRIPPLKTFVKFMQDRGLNPLLQQIHLLLTTHIWKHKHLHLLHEHFQLWIEVIMELNLPQKFNSECWVTNWKVFIEGCYVLLLHRIHHLCS